MSRSSRRPRLDSANSVLKIIYDGSALRVSQMLMYKFSDMINTDLKVISNIKGVDVRTNDI